MRRELEHYVVIKIDLIESSFANIANRINIQLKAHTIFQLGGFLLTKVIQRLINQFTSLHVLRIRIPNDRRRPGDIPPSIDERQAIR